MAKDSFSTSGFDLGWPYSNVKLDSVNIQMDVSHHNT
jgi:hypothetical protein